MLVVIVLRVISIVNGDIIRLIGHEIEVNPCRTERPVGEDAAQATHLWLVQLHAIRESLVYDRHTCHIIIISHIVQFLVSVCNIDIVQGVLDVFIHSSLYLESTAASCLHRILEEVGTQGGDYEYLSRDFVFPFFPYDGVSVAELRVLDILAAHEPHLLQTVRPDA